MEDNIQTIIMVIISAFLLFIFPVYMAYEKKDDVSYALAVRYTQDLVDNVRSRGYLSKDMYDDYKARLKVTGNSYDVELTHDYLRYDPITNYYTKDDDGNYQFLRSSTQEVRYEKEKVLKEEAEALGLKKDEEILNYINEFYENQKIYKVENTYKYSSERYTTNYIESILYSENKLVLTKENENGANNCKDASNYCINAYTMNVGDNFNVTIKNTNTTLATFIYNMITANTLDSNTRIYVNYGGDILSTKWFGNLDYNMMKHDNVSLIKLQEIFSMTEELSFNLESRPVQNINKEYDGEYILTFDVKPEETTELKEKGDIGKQEINGYNFAFGNSIKKNKDSTLAVSVGMNGISLITNNTDVIKATTETSLVLPTYQVPITRTRIVTKEETVVDEETKEETIVTKQVEEEYTEYETRQRVITDYSKIKVNYISKGKVRIEIESKTGDYNISETITIKDPNDLLNGLNVEKTNLEPNMIITGNLGKPTNPRGTDIEYNINIGETVITVNATRYVSNEMVILSYPVTIDSLSNIRIELKKNENDKYVALAYLNDEFLEESAEMKDSPTANTIGQTIFGISEPMYFSGKISNVHLYN